MANENRIPLIIPGVEPLPFHAKEVIKDDDKIIIVQPEQMHGELRRAANMGSVMRGERLILYADGIPVARCYIKGIERRFHHEGYMGRGIAVRDEITADVNLEFIDYDEIINHRNTNPSSLDPAGFAW